MGTSAQRVENKNKNKNKMKFAASCEVFAAAFQGNTPFLIANPFDVHLKDDKGRTLLYSACRGASVPEVVSLLLTNGASPNEPSTDVVSFPLHALVAKWNEKSTMKGATSQSRSTVADSIVQCIALLRGNGALTDAKNSHQLSAVDEVVVGFPAQRKLIVAALESPHPSVPLLSSELVTASVPVAVSIGTAAGPGNAVEAIEESGDGSSKAIFPPPPPAALKPLVFITGTTSIF